MELTQVRYFIALCRTLNFTRAAEACNVTQPALTRAIQRLEDELGGPLLYRERNLTQLTELGGAMRPHLEAMLEAAEAARQAARASAGMEVASIRIGLGPAIAAAHVAPRVRGLVRLSRSRCISRRRGRRRWPRRCCPTRWIARCCRTVRACRSG